MIMKPKKKWEKPEIKTLGFKKTYSGEVPNTTEEYGGS